MRAIKPLFRQPFALARNRPLALRLGQAYHRLVLRRDMLAYQHIPKTGGTYLVQHGQAASPVIWPIRSLGHALIVDPTGRPYGPIMGFRGKRDVSTEVLKHYFIFSTARNIFSWLVSYAGHAGGWNPKYVDRDHYDYQHAQKGFDYLLKTIADRDEGIWPSRRFIHFQLFSNAGDLMVDWISHMESLDQDLADLAATQRVTYRPKSRARVGVHRDYRSYYDDALVDLVNETWGRELKLLGYDFDGYDPQRAILPREVGAALKKRVHYSWHDNRLLIDGQEVP